MPDAVPPPLAPCRSTPVPASGGSGACGSSSAAGVHALLYPDRKPARRLALTDIAAPSLSPQELLWVDLCAPDEATLRTLETALRIPNTLSEFIRRSGDSPELLNAGEWFAVRVLVARVRGRLQLCTAPLHVLCGPNAVVTLAAESLEVVADLRERHRGNRALGSLSAESFATALLDDQLATYYDAMSRLEMEVEQLEVTLLSSRKSDCLDLLRSLRKAASRLRRALAAHRGVFGRLARPDFRPQQESTVVAHFSALETRYERAMDLAEHGRDLVVGTFELFTTRAAMSTNETMKVLTFVTVLFGALAVLAGILGMNFEASFFASSNEGFWTAVGAMGLLSLGGVWLARRRDWL